MISYDYIYSAIIFFDDYMTCCILSSTNYSTKSSNTYHPKYISSKINHPKQIQTLTYAERVELGCKALQQQQH